MKRKMLFVLFAIACVYNSFAQENSKPNIIIILADDLGYGDVSSYYKDSKIKTPNIDNLAANGIKFINAHSASSVCTPSRYSILTGRYPWRSKLKAGVLWSYDWPLIEDERTTIAEFLQNTGYKTALIGKWHLGWRWPVKEGETIDTIHFGGRNQEQSLERESKIDLTRPLKGGPLSAGFDYQFGLDIPSLPPFAFIENGKIVGSIPDKLKPDTISGSKGLMQEEWDSRRILPTLMDTAISYIEKNASASKEQPFFLYLPLSAPHVPIAPSKEFIGKSGAGDYGDFVVEIDYYVGKMMDVIKKENISNNTLVFFTSDNGPTMQAGDRFLRNSKWDVYGSEYSMFGHNSSANYKGMKGDIWEGGHRIPLIAYWPGMIPAGKTSDVMISLTDFYATCAGFLNKKVPENEPIDSHDYSSFMMQPKTSVQVRNDVVFHSSTGKLSIEKDDWKLILTNNSGGSLKNVVIKNDDTFDTPGQLYNMKTDPYETINVYKSHPEIVEELTKLLEEIKNAESK